MRFPIIILTTIFLTNCEQPKTVEEIVSKNDSYQIILKTDIPVSETDPETKKTYTSEIPGEIDDSEIEKLNEPLKALAAFYSALGGTMCDGENCELTTALGLGKQGSETHKNLIANYFPNDKVAETVLKQDLYLRPSGASTFSDYEFLTITDKRDTVLVDYKLMYYNRGEIEWIEGPDIYSFKDSTFKKIKRNLWTFVEE